jgi:hypothetical protein
VHGYDSSGDVSMVLILVILVILNGGDWSDNNGYSDDCAYDWCYDRYWQVNAWL